MQADTAARSGSQTPLDQSFLFVNVTPIHTLFNVCWLQPQADQP